MGNLNHWLTSETNELHRLLVERYTLAAQLVSGVVLDWACNHGYGTSMLLTDRVTRILGMDLDPRGIDYARQRVRDPRVTFALGDMERAKVPAADWLVCCETLEHLVKPLAFLRRALQTAIDDPDQVEKLFGLPVYASIPHSKMQQTLVNGGRDPTRLPLLSRIASMDVAVEGLRNFRTALQFCLSRTDNHVVLITGPTEGMCKSFVSVNLASIMAASGKRVLLIDSDLRDGHLHRYFHSERAGGLSDILAGAKPSEVLRASVLENLDFISTGTLPPNPAELLMRPTLAAMLAELTPHYDIVLIDAAPLLAVADSLIIGEHVGAIFLTARSGVTRPGEIAEALMRLSRAGLAARGVLFNDMTARPGRYGYGTRYGYGKFRQLGYAPETQRVADA
jgi:capsular exopolysaccharide synthesis family protein